MTPDDVLCEAIAAASLHGDSAELRQEMCAKLKEAVRKVAAAKIYDLPLIGEE